MLYNLPVKLSYSFKPQNLEKRIRQYPRIITTVMALNKRYDVHVHVQLYM